MQLGESEERELALEVALDLVALRSRPGRPTCSPPRPARGRLRGCSRRCARPAPRCPACASTSSITTLASSIACSVLITENFSITSRHLAALAHAGGVDQRVVAAAAIEVEVERIARRARLVEGDDALLAEQRVDQRGLADVRAADDRDLDASSRRAPRVGSPRAPPADTARARRRRGRGRSRRARTRSAAACRAPSSWNSAVQRARPPCPRPC